MRMRINISFQLSSVWPQLLESARPMTRVGSAITARASSTNDSTAVDGLIEIDQPPPVHAHASFFLPSCIFLSSFMQQSRSSLMQLVLFAHQSSPRDLNKPHAYAFRLGPVMLRRTCAQRPGSTCMHAWPWMEWNDYLCTGTTGPHDIVISSSVPIGFHICNQLTARNGCRRRGHGDGQSSSPPLLK